MPAGNRRHKITIQRATFAPDAEGQNVATWADFYVGCWARRVFQGKGSERLAAQQPVAMTTPSYEVYADSLSRQITSHERFRIVDGDRTYDIEDAVPNERGSLITLYVRGRSEAAA